MSGRIDLGGLEEVLGRLQNQPVGAYHIRSPYYRPEPYEVAPTPPEVIAAVRESETLLSEHQWCRVVRLRDIALAHGMSTPRLLAAIPRLAGSDSGHWCCIPGPMTPGLAPDGT